MSLLDGYKDRYTGMNFTVQIPPIELAGNFSSVSGLGAQMQYEEYREGGNFTSPVYLPTGMKYNNIVLERGTMTLEPLALWYATVQAGSHIRYPMIVTMFDATRKPVKIWMVADAMPINIDYSPMNAMGNGSVAVTTVEFIHGEVVSIM